MHTLLRKRLDKPFNSWDVLKLVALGLMLVDHVGTFFFPDDHWLRAIGRGAAPIFLWLTGYAAAYRLDWEIVLLALIHTVSNMLLLGHIDFPLTILFTIIITRLVFHWGASRHPRPLLGWVLACMIWLPSIFIIEYGTFGILFALCAYVKKHPDIYPKSVRLWLWVFSFALYALNEGFIKDFGWIDTGITWLMVSVIAYALWHFKIHSITRPATVPPAMMLLGKWASCYMAYIYVVHLILLSWITRVPA